MKEWNCLKLIQEARAQLPHTAIEPGSYELSYELRSLYIDALFRERAADKCGEPCSNSTHNCTQCPCWQWAAERSPP